MQLAPLTTAVALVALSGVAAAARPTAGPVSGTYKAGSLSGGARLADEGKDHYLVFPPRCFTRATSDANAWAHPSVVAAVTEVAHDVRAAFPDAQRVPVGELSAQSGGKIDHHLSHQNGLDVDVCFLRRNVATSSLSTLSRQPSVATGLLRCKTGPRYERQDPESGRWEDSQDFDRELAWALAARFAARPDVKVIFVGTLLKPELARWARANGVPPKERSRTLAKLYPVFCRAPKGVVLDTYKRNWCPHDDHLHVRFRCPKDSPGCRAR